METSTVYAVVLAIAWLIVIGSSVGEIRYMVKEYKRQKREKENSR